MCSYVFSVFGCNLFPSLLHSKHLALGALMQCTLLYWWTFSSYINIGLESCLLESSNLDKERIREEKVKKLCFLPTSDLERFNIESGGWLQKENKNIIFTELNNPLIRELVPLIHHYSENDCFWQSSVQCQNKFNITGCLIKNSE